MRSACEESELGESAFQKVELDDSELEKSELVKFELQISILEESEFVEPEREKSVLVQPAWEESGFGESELVKPVHGDPVLVKPELGAGEMDPHFLVVWGWQNHCPGSLTTKTRSRQDWVYGGQTCGPVGAKKQVVWR